jgi:hypothetical protein
LFWAAGIAAIITFFIGFALHGSGLQSIAYGQIGDGRAAAVQAVLDENLDHAATYIIPDDSSAAQSRMYEQGPIATIHFADRGAPALDPVALVLWVGLAAAVALLIGVGLRASRGRAGSAVTAVCFAIAAAAYIRLGEPILYHLDWTYFVFHFATDSLVLATIGIVMARWGAVALGNGEREGPPLTPADGK